MRLSRHAVWVSLLLTGGVLVALGATRPWETEEEPTSDRTLVLRDRAGPYRYWGELGPGEAYERAVAAFGIPSARGKAAPTSRTCTVRWESHGVDVDFVGAAGCGDAALRRRGSWLGMRLWGPGWTTESGLRVGDSAETIRKLYPDARYVSEPPTPGYWTLVVRQSQDFGRVPLLIAQVGAGRVVAIEVPPGFVH